MGEGNVRLILKPVFINKNIDLLLYSMNFVINKHEVFLYDFLLHVYSLFWHFHTLRLNLISYDIFTLKPYVPFGRVLIDREVKYYSGFELAD